jgi:hypothetical protein
MYLQSRLWLAAEADVDGVALAAWRGTDACHVLNATFCFLALSGLEGQSAACM